MGKDTILMSKFDYELYRRISEPYDNLFWNKKKELDNRFGITVSLVSVSVDVQCETEIEYDEKLVHADGTVGLTFIKAHTRTFMPVMSIYMVDREKIFVKTVFELDGIELGEVLDKLYSDLEEKAQNLFAPHEKETEKDGEK